MRIEIKDKKIKFIIDSEISFAELFDEIARFNEEWDDYEIVITREIEKPALNLPFYPIQINPYPVVRETYPWETYPWERSVMY